jgi:uncharacterized protein YqgC (DUF456 family)
VNELAIAAVALVMAIGLMGTLLPLLPGLPLVWLGAFAYGLVDGFHSRGWIAMTVITVLLVAGIGASFVLPRRRASEAGAPRSSQLVGAVAGVIGFFVIPVVGLPLGAVAGVLVAEYRRTRDWSRAWRATRGVVVGFGLAALFELGAGIAMVATWLVWVLARP